MIEHEYYINQSSKKRHKALEEMVEEYGEKDTKAMLKRMEAFYGEGTEKANTKHARNDLRWLNKHIAYAYG